MTFEELKQLVKEKGSKALCKERIKKSKSVQRTKNGYSFNVIKDIKATKGVDFEVNANELGVEVVANMAMFLDSDQDVLIKESWSRSIQERGEGDIIPFLGDHFHSIEGLIGKTVRFKDGQVDLNPLGYTGFGDALIHQALVLRDYNEKAYEKYKQGSIKQHSIGLIYEDIVLAINDPEFEEEHKTYTSYIDKIINKEEVSKIGYFWLVKRIKLIENSAVLFGANSLTPTLSVQPPQGTEDGKSQKENRNFYYHLIRKGNEQI